MKTLLRRWELPLLVKELNEQAYQRRTYIIRFVYAAILFTVACGLFYGNLGNANDNTSILGRGQEMFQWLVLIQFWSICLVLPAMTCGAIASEKERNSLGLLILTTLRPWEILFQKLASRLIPIFTFLLLSFPLMAIAYSFGGVTLAELQGAIIFLLFTCLQVGVLSLMCSAYFRTTTEAFVATYLLLALSLAFRIGPFVNSSNWAESWEFLSIYRLLYLTALWMAAVFFLQRRAFIQPRNVMLQFFRFLDGIFNEANQITGGVVLVRDTDSYPADNPISWRETRKKSLGTVRYLFRVLVVLELPILFVAQMLRGPGSFGDDTAMFWLRCILWCVAAAMVAVHAAGLISSERSHETLDVLLTAPITGREIITEKFSGVRRLIAVLCVPFFSIFAFEFWWQRTTPTRFVIWSCLTVLIYLPLIAWLAMWLGLRIRSQMRTILISICALVIWAVAPFVVRYLVTNVFGGQISEMGEFLFLYSPASVVPVLEKILTEKGQLNSLDFYAAANILFYGSILLFARHQCLSKADRHLGRMEQPASAAPATIVVAKVADA